MPDEYYQMAKMLKPLDRQGLSVELRRFHQQTVDQVVEYALNVVGQAESENWTIAEIRENIRKIELKGPQFTNDRTHLKHCEAILYALRSRKAVIVSKREIANAFDHGHGIDVGTVNETALEIVLHPRKFEGE